MDKVIPIPSLTPTSTIPSSCAIRAVVTLSWPFSSSTRQCALLLADPDFRLRYRKGQVRVRFTGASAIAVAESHVGIGDEVVLQLEGAKWLQQEEGLVRTPGRSVDGELVFAQRLGLRLVRDDGEVSVEVDAPESPPKAPLRASGSEDSMATPAAVRAVASLRADVLDQVERDPTVYPSPAFAKSGWLVGNTLRDTSFDPFVDKDDLDQSPRKRQRISFGDVRDWRFAEKTPPPVYEGQTVPAEGRITDVTSSSERDDGFMELAQLERHSFRLGRLPPQGPATSFESAYTEPTQPNTPSSGPEAGVDDSLLETPSHLPADVTDAPTFDTHQTATEMPPPPLPRLQMPGSSPFLATQQAVMQNQERPTTPELKPVSAANLPLPSPFPTEMAQQPQFPTMGLPTEPSNIGQEASHSAEVIEIQLVNDGDRPHDHTPNISESFPATSEDQLDSSPLQRSQASSSLRVSRQEMQLPQANNEELLSAANTDVAMADISTVSTEPEIAVPEHVQAEGDVFHQDFESDLVKSSDRDNARNMYTITGDVVNDFIAVDPIQDMDDLVEPSLLEPSPPLVVANTSYRDASKTGDSSNSETNAQMLSQQSPHAKSSKQQPPFFDITPLDQSTPRKLEYPSLDGTVDATPKPKVITKSDQTPSLSQNERQHDVQQKMTMNRMYRSLFGYVTTPELERLARQPSPRMDVSPWMTEEEKESLARIIDHEMPLQAAISPDWTQREADNELIAMDEDSPLPTTSTSPDASPAPVLEHVTFLKTGTEILENDLPGHASQPVEPQSLEISHIVQRPTSTTVVDLGSSSDNGDDEDGAQDQPAAAQIAHDATFHVRPSTSPHFDDSQTYSRPAVGDISDEDGHNYGMSESAGTSEPSRVLGATIEQDNGDQDMFEAAAAQSAQESTTPQKSPISLSQSLEHSIANLSPDKSSSFVQLSSSPVAPSPRSGEEDVIMLDLSQAERLESRPSVSRDAARTTPGIPDSLDSPNTTIVSASSRPITRDGAFGTSTQFQLTQASLKRTDPEPTSEFEAMASQDLALVPSLLQPARDQQLGSTDTVPANNPATAHNESMEGAASSEADLLEESPRSSVPVDIARQPLREEDARTEESTSESLSYLQQAQAQQESTLNFSALDGIATQVPMADSNSVNYPTLPLSPLDSQPQTSLSDAKSTRTPAMLQNEASIFPPTPRPTQGETSDVKAAQTTTEATIVPAKTPSRRSLRLRLSSVPEVLSTWFSPKRSPASPEKVVERPVSGPKPSPQSGFKAGLRRSSRSSGFNTSQAYFAPLSNLDEKLNPSSQAASPAGVDVLAVVTTATKPAERAKVGPRDYFTAFRIQDSSLPAGSTTRVEVFRPWRAVLPFAEVGDVVLLRGFAVKSRKHQPYLLSNDASAWCVWRFADAKVAEDNERKPAWARKATDAELSAVREEIKGPPVELGDEERRHVHQLRNWWLQLQNKEGADNQDSVADESGEGRANGALTAKL